MPDLDRSPGLLLAVLALAGLEAAWRLRSGRGYDGRAALTSLAVSFGNIVVGATLGAAIVASGFFAVWSAAPVRWPVDDWRTWAVGFFAVEFAYYWMHRWSHEIRWLWANHAVHHTSEELTFLAALRLGWTGWLSGAWVVFLPLTLAGFHPVVVAALLAFNLNYQLLLHTEVVGKLGWLELVFNTPSHHRVHHASNAAYLDRNFGGVLIIFDRLFGTFAQERADEPCRFGLVPSLPSRNPFVVALHEWRALARDALAARSLPALAHALFGAPGAPPPIPARCSKE